MSTKLVLEHEMTVKCAGVTVKPPRGPDRMENVYTVDLVELDEKKQGLQGAVKVRDVPHEMARQFGDHLTKGRRYRLTFQVEELPDAQRDMFDEDEADDEARAKASGGEPVPSSHAPRMQRHGKALAKKQAAIRAGVDAIKDAGRGLGASRVTLTSGDRSVTVTGKQLEQAAGRIAARAARRHKPGEH